MSDDTSVWVQLVLATIPATLTAGFAFSAGRFAIKAAADRDLANHRRDQLARANDLAQEVITEADRASDLIRDLHALAKANDLDRIDRELDRLHDGDKGRRLSLHCGLWFPSLNDHASSVHRRSNEVHRLARAALDAAKTGDEIAHAGHKIELLTADKGLRVGLRELSDAFVALAEGKKPEGVLFTDEDVEQLMTPLERT